MSHPNRSQQDSGREAAPPYPDAAGIAAQVNAGDLDPGAVVSAFQARIDARNGELNAVFEERRDLVDADVAQLRERLAAGERPPLAGVPVIVKDVVWVRGRRVTQGSLLYRDFVAPADAIAVERLRAAGAIVLGMGNTSEFACKGLTTNKVYGLTRHPQDTALTAGGSSGGCAVAVAAGMAPLALGTDGGGSSRRPPAHAGVVGFKPSFGAIPDAAGFPHAFPGIQVMAPITRTVDDAALMFRVLCGPDPRDPDSMGFRCAAAGPLDGIRIAVSPRLGLDTPVDDDVAEAFEAAVARLEAAGVPGLRVARQDPVWPDGAGEAALMPLQHVGLANLHGDAWRRDPDRFDPDIARQIERGFAWSGAEVARAREASRRIGLALAAFFTEHDLLLCPTTPCVAWPNDRLGPERIGGVAVEPRAHAVFTPFFNHAQAPAISVPCGTGRDGLPVGLQIAGPRGADWRVLAAARLIEQLLAAG
ncbi:amidase [Cupriavidus gilardii]|uniref:amidase n=1 Tax=Cupriavidus gilardii TaxID=82541 RepID=UPI00157FD693|nr:amidase [Cupriavidus gilardii]MCT9069928.1 amidase [Cupriavidus gilardii]QKS62072.1 amidase [Cupriavidus gilardii]